ncbi:DNA polymerase Y family protein [Williamsia sterculiae]|uniref:Protein ImuB n=1 Tax=Williamsia sterculiae TaxID=1344003 RepID=A0A1N7DVI5_9NOCA|nr:DNA polymerase Y family protein [Williamsia sterculiae]SIR79840.1 protein ImuB [Williamsia sterculiae]
MARALGLWCPDWPAAAAAATADSAPERPVAVFSANRVVACSAPARAVGIRRGMRRREAQAICPELVVAADDPGRDGRLFEPVVAEVAELVPAVEVLRPGLMVLPVAGATRCFGGEESAAEKLIDVVSACGVESQTGIADHLATAVIAARHGVVVAPGAGADYLAPLPVGELAVEPSLCREDRSELVDLLWRMGIRTVGAFAGLSATDVATRFGADAVYAHRTARDLPDRPPSGVPPGADLMVEHHCDPPVDRVDAAAFVGRRLAEELHRVLMAAAVACTRLTVHAVTTGGQEHSRTWRCAAPLTPEATADRIRWQLEGWLTGRGTDDRPDGPIGVLRLEPVELVRAGELQYELSGAGLPGSRDLDERVHRSLVRVQGLLGGESVRIPVRSGGRGPQEQISLIPLGDEPTPAADPTAPWPGRMPEPTPTVLMSAPVEMRDCADDPVRVTSRGGFSAEPTTLRWGRRSWELCWWAGPWMADEQWWAAADSAIVARAQVLLDDSRALLLRYRHDDRQWLVEGVYE